MSSQNSGHNDVNTTKKKNHTLLILLKNNLYIITKKQTHATLTAGVFTFMNPLIMSSLIDSVIANL